MKSSLTQGRRRRFAALSLAAAAAMAATQKASAQPTYTYVGASSSDWNSGNNWVSGFIHGVPPAGDSALVEDLGVQSDTITYDGTYVPSNALAGLTLDGENGSNVFLNIASSTLALHNATTLGDLVLGDPLGDSTTGQGTINLSGTGVLQSNGNEEIGYNGNGTINQTGGTHNVTNGYSVYLGVAGGTGVYSISGGIFDVGNAAEPNSDLWVGYGNPGEFTQSGGTVDVTDAVYLSGLDPIPPQALYSISDGLLTTGFLGVGGQEISAGGTAALIVSNTGSVSVTTSGPDPFAGDIYIWPGSTVTILGGSVTANVLNNDGTLNQSGGNLSISSTENIGEYGSGSVAQTGGSNSTGQMILGSQGGSAGSYSLSAGSVEVDNTLQVGQVGSGSFAQSGGTVETDYLNVGGDGSQNGNFHNDGSGAYTLSGGHLQVDNDATIGAVNGEGAGIGIVDQSGGSFAASYLYVGPHGTYNLHGTGYLNAQLLVTGTFHQSDSTSSAYIQNSLTVDQESGNPGSYTLDAGSLYVAGTEYIGPDGDSSFTQNGGTNTSHGVDLVGSPSFVGTPVYSMAGGSLAVSDGNLIVGQYGPASFSHTGGSVSVSGNLSLAPNSNAVGTYTLSGDAAVSASSETIGGMGLGTFNQNGGINTVLGLLTINSFNNQIFSVYNLNGGQLIVGGDLVNNGIFNSNGGSLSVSGSISGAGVINQISGALQLGDNSTIGSGTVAFQGGNTTATNLTVTSNNNAIVNVSSTGGATTLSGLWTVTTPEGSTGAVHVVSSAGSLYVDTGVFSGNTDWTITGTADVTIGGGLSVNNLSINSGSLTVSSGTPPVGEDPELNYAIVAGYDGSGTFAVSGTAVVNSPDIKLGITSGDSGVMTQTGGTVTVGTLTVGQDVSPMTAAGAGTVNISGGVLNASTVLLGSTSGGSGAMTVSGTAQVNVGGGLDANDFTLSGGTVTVATGRPPTGEDGELHYAMVAGYEHNGAIYVSSGTLNTPIIKLGIASGKTGSYTQTGGTVVVHDSTGSLPGGGDFSIGNDTSLGSGGGIGVAAISAGTLTADHLLIGSTVGGSGSLTISGSGKLTTGSLSLASNGKIIINGGSLLISYGTNPDPVATIRTYLIAGYNSGSWLGADIDSTAAAANHSYALGYADSADSGNPAGLSSHNIEIKYTLYGDTTLDGTVNSVDFGNLAANFGKSGKVWDQGDFDYNGTVNSIDFGLLAGNFGKSAGGGSVVTASDWSALYAFADANGLMSEVPEPLSTTITAIAAVGVLARRTRRRI
jgi:hypothetical protein